MSAAVRKEKGRRGAGLLRERRLGRWAAAGLKEKVRSFSIFSFPFSNCFKIQTFSTQIHSKLFKLFHKTL
jgi:hypothetical protein